MSENVARMKQMDPNASAGKPGELLITLMSPSEAQIKAVNDWMNSKKAVLIHEHKFPPSKILHVKVDEDLANEMLQEKAKYVSMFKGTMENDAEGQIAIEPNNVVHMLGPYPQ